jgi:hypothetical protein
LIAGRIFESSPALISAQPVGVDLALLVLLETSAAALFMILIPENEILRKALLNSTVAERLIDFRAL